MRSFSVTCTVFALAGLGLAFPAWSGAGISERVAGASLLVPFFESGIDSATHPQDTLLVVNNRSVASVTFHFHVWDIDGVATSLEGNVTLAGRETWSRALRDLLATSTPAVRSQLTDGVFYRGFMTLDAVTAATALPPTDSLFPFASSNVLEGWIYYARLAQGSANGLAMVPLESVPSLDPSDVLRGFYRSSMFTFDDRESLGAFARFCAARLATRLDCSGGDFAIERIDFRVFRSAALSGRTRAIIFAWAPRDEGGPSVQCDVDPGACDGSAFPFRRYDESGTLIASTSIRLDHAVNVIEINGGPSGWASILDIPASGHAVQNQFYAFVFNSASPPGNPAVNWDAIFEAYIEP